MYMTLCQSVMEEQKWREDLASYENMELKGGNNSVEVKVDNDYFRVWINGKKFKDSIPVNPDRILSYSHLTLKQSGSCASFDLRSSFVEFLVGCNPGTYRDSKITTCTSCTSGLIPNEEGTKCEPCPAGTHRPADKTGCEVCVGNTISTEGADSCTPCDTGLLANSNKTICGTRVYLADLKKKDDDILTPLPVVTNTHFYLNLMFNGIDSTSCRLYFDIIDTRHETMYRVNFRLSYQMLRQNSFLDGEWQLGNNPSTGDMELKNGENAVEVKVEKDYFRVWVNGEKFNDSVPVDPVRLSNYSSIRLTQFEFCGYFDLETSFVEYRYTRTRVYFHDLEQVGNSTHTPIPVGVSTSFFLDVTFSGQYTTGCGLSFNIYDSEQMYHLDFRLNYKETYKRLVQSHKLSYWRSGSVDYLQLQQGSNDVKVKVGSDFFRVWVNGVKFPEAVRLDRDRLINFRYLTLVQSKPSCVSVNSGTSFVEYPAPCLAGTYRSLVMESCEVCVGNTISTKGADSCTSCIAGYLANSNKTICGTTAYFADLERTDNKMYTPLPVQIGTSFFLHVTFSGTYPHGCGFNFYIKDTTSIYVADFRLNYRGMYKQLLQDYQTHTWMAASVESLELKAGTNNVEIKVNGDFFRVWVNGVQFQVVVSVNPDRLSEYSHFEVGQPLPSCVSVDLQKSFVDFAKPCKGGTYRDSSMLECERCPANTHCSEGAGLCTTCPHGSTASEDATRCVSCDGLPESWLQIKTETQFPLLPGSVVSLECSTGYSLTGDTTVTCGEGTVFSFSTAPACVLDKCETLPDIENLETAAEFPVSYNTPVTVTCRSGFSLEGSDVITCIKGENYRTVESVLPFCKENTCKGIMIENYLSTNASFPITYGTAITVACDPQYDLLGSNVITCKEGIVYSHSSRRPKCVNKDSPIS
ncbi:hypothetical protein ACHWQZ_G010705 [Mnemiopsis leidyi]